MTTHRKPRPRPTFRAAPPAYVPASEPRPDASKIVAAQRRARPAPETPATSRPSLRPYLVPGCVVGAILVAALIATRMPSVPPMQPLAITTAPTSLPAALSAPTAAPTPRSTVLAYAAPDGAVLGPIDMLAEHAVPVARYGEGWAQLARADRTTIWVKTSDVPVYPLSELPDLQPQIAAVEPPQTGQGLTLYQEPPAPAAEPEVAPEPTPWPTSAPAQASDFAAPAASDRCKFIGCLPGSALDQQAQREPLCHALYWQYGADEVKPADQAAVWDCIKEGLYK